MEELHHVAWLARQALGFAILLWPVTLVVTGFLLYNFALRARAAEASSAITGGGWLRLLTPTVFSLIILIFGSMMTWPSSSQTMAPTWPLHTIYLLVGLQLLLSIVIVWKASGHRMLASAIVVFQFWITCMFANVAGMSVTGNWI